MSLQFGLSRFWYFPHEIRYQRMKIGSVVSTLIWIRPVRVESYWQWMTLPDDLWVVLLYGKCLVRMTCTPGALYRSQVPKISRYFSQYLRTDGLETKDHPGSSSVNITQYSICHPSLHSPPHPFPTPSPYTSPYPVCQFVNWTYRLRRYYFHPWMWTCTRTLRQVFVDDCNTIQCKYVCWYRRATIVLWNVQSLPAQKHRTCFSCGFLFENVILKWLNSFKQH